LHCRAFFGALPATKIPALEEVAKVGLMNTGPPFLFINL
jgi:hypothetical protein